MKIREGNVANRPIYVAFAVTCEGTRDILGLWAGEHGDGEGYGTSTCSFPPYVLLPEVLPPVGVSLMLKV